MPKVTFARDHSGTVNGTPNPRKGDVVEVDERTAAALRKFGIVEGDKADEKPAENPAERRETRDENPAEGDSADETEKRPEVDERPARRGLGRPPKNRQG